MNTVALFKSLQDIFTLPALQVKENTELNDWYWEGTNIVLNVSLKGKDDDHHYILKVDIKDFRAHCELTNEIPEGAFCEWFDNLLGFDQEVEIESYANKFLAEIKADYAAWISTRDNHRKAI